MDKKDIAVTHFGEDYAIINYHGEDEEVSRFCGIVILELLNGATLDVCPIYNDKVLPNEDGNCSLCELHKA